MRHFGRISRKQLDPIVASFDKEGTDWFSPAQFFSGWCLLVTFQFHIVFVEIKDLSFQYLYEFTLLVSKGKLYYFLSPYSVWVVQGIHLDRLSTLACSIPFCNAVTCIGSLNRSPTC
jgi:hypothetical protein